MNQEQDSKPQCLASKWDTIKPQGAIWCDHCQTGYSGDYLLRVGVVLAITLSHNTYKLRALA